MKSILIFLFGCVAPAFSQQERARPDKEAIRVLPQPSQGFPDLLAQRSLNRLEGKLGVVFNIPFPVAHFDFDVYRRQSLALLPVEGETVVVTRPIINPYDDNLTIEWMTGLKDVTKLGRVSLDALVDLDERGDFIQINLPASPDEWSAEKGTSGIQRNDGETAGAFVERALWTYRLRAQKAADPKQANLLLSGFEKILKAIDQCRKEEAAN